MKSQFVAALSVCAVACSQTDRHTAPPSPFGTNRTAKGPDALFNNGGFENGDMSGWTVETFLNGGVTYPTLNGTQVPPQTLSDLGLQAGGVANTSAVGPQTAGTQLPNGLSSTTTLRWPIYGAYSSVVNGQHDVAQLNGSNPYGANQNVNSVKQDMVVQTTDIDPMDGLAHVRFVVAPVLQNPSHSTNQQPYYYIHVKNLTTGQELFNRFNYVSQAGVPWQSDANGSIQYLPWQVVDVAAPGLINVGDDLQAQVIAAGCSLGGHWGEAYVDAFGAFLPGLSVAARQPQFANEGANVTATYTVSNDAANTMTNVVVTLPTPNNATFASFTPPAGMTCTNIPAAGATGTISCSISSMAPFSAQTFSIVWTAKTGLTLPADMGNGSYGVKSDQQQFLLGMPATTFLTDSTKISYADYSVSIDDGQTSVSPGQQLTYTITVKNNGPATPLKKQGQTQVLYPVPIAETNSTGGLSNVTWTCAAAGTSGSYTSACGAASGTGLINSTIALVSGGTATYVVKGTAGAPTSGNYINNTVALTTSSMPSGYGDPESANNTIGDTDQYGVLVGVTATKDASGTGTGLVSSAPAGIACGAACSTATAQFANTAPVTLTAVADTNMMFAGWTAGPCSGSTQPQCTFTPSSATTATAKFDILQFTITGTANGAGTISCTSPVNSGAKSTCTIAASGGATLASVTDNGADVTASVSNGAYILSNVNQNHAVVATFSAVQFTITGGPGVSCISPVNSGGSSICSITPPAGFVLTAITDNGVTVPATGSTYTILNITANHVVAATFRAANAFACTQGSDCASGSCVDGVCCDTACDGQCQACDVPDHVGTCTAVTGAPHGDRTACATDGSSCGGTCDGTNTASCTYPTTSCRDASCANGTATLAAACDGAGNCPAVRTQTCTPYACGATACNGDCKSDGDCANGQWCSAGICTPKQTNGAACSGNDQCGSGTCVDGVCCNTACDGQCEACNAPGSAGTCTPVAGAPIGARDACVSDGSACGGACDGVHGASCTYPGESTTCRDASCGDGTATLAATCNGSGSCPAAQTQSCSPYLCGATACKGDCAVDTDCVDGDYCAAGICAPKIANGGSCGGKNQCASGECVDGVCCNVACDGQCQACDVAGSVGTCTAVAGAPHGARTACGSDGSSCGGACDGTNTTACAYPADECRGASCADGVATLAAACDGQGHCPAAQQQTCSPYACNGTACAGNCASNGDCAAGDYCSAGVCVTMLAQGGSCSSDAQCGTGHCVDGVCCNTSCDGQCEACNAPGSVGVCSAVAGAPRGGRAACATDGSACGGACDGTTRDACTFPTSSCRSESACANSVKTDAASCDGAGHCPAVVQEVCSTTAPPPTVAACTTDADCAASDYCSAGACKSRGHWVVAGAGGCTSTGAAAWPLVLLLGAFAMRRRKAGVVAALAVAGAASAQSTSFTVDRFQPGAGAYDVLGVASPETARDFDWHLSAYADYARDPLRLVSVDQPDQVQLLRSQSMLHLGASIGFGEHFELGAVLPVALSQGAGAAPQVGIGGVGAGGVGDLRLLPKVRIVSFGDFVFGAGLPVTLPTGRTDSFLGQGSLTATPTALVEWQHGFRLTANAGVILRGKQQLTNLDVGNAFSYGLGAEIPLREKLAALTTLQGEWNFGDGGAVERPLELMAAIRWSMIRGVDFIAGGGPGLTNGYGTPRYRVFASFAFTPGVLPARKVAPAPAPRFEPLPAPIVLVKHEEPPPPPAPVVLPLPPPEPPKQLAKLDADTGKIDLLAPVRFAHDKDLLLGDSVGALDAAVSVLLAHPEIARVRIEGHTDNHGKPAYNKLLSQRRARAVLKYLQTKGVHQRLESAGFGDEKPVDTNATEEGRAKNRRVELVIVEKRVATR